MPQPLPPDSGDLHYQPISDVQLQEQIEQLQTCIAELEQQQHPDPEPVIYIE